MTQYSSLPDYKIQPLYDRKNALEELFSRGSTEQGSETAIDLSVEYKDVCEIINSWETLSRLTSQYQQALELATDPELKDEALKEIDALSLELAAEHLKFKGLTQQKLPDDDKKALVEFRAGTGGTEAALFTEEVMRMYMRYFAKQNYPTEIINLSYQSEGGVKEATVAVNYPGSFGKLRFESGVNRVQRVPSTESSGRIHTSAISIAVLPQIETKDIEINNADLRIEVFRASGPGGQSVNTTDSAVRLTHIPTGITVSCQDGKSQHKNKERALGVLASKLYELQQQELSENSQAIRTAAVGDGDRSAKIRTYNFPQGRVTDHRTKMTLFNIAEILEGELHFLITETNRILRDNAQ
jgi:peptide chain release factor 1